MDQIACSGHGLPAPVTTAEVRSASGYPYPQLFSESRALDTCCLLLERLAGILNRMCTACNSGMPLSSSGSLLQLIFHFFTVSYIRVLSLVLYILETIEIVMLCIINLTDYRLIVHLDSVSVALATSLISTGQTCVDILYGVTPSTSRLLSPAFDVGHLSGSEVGKIEAKEWEISPCLDKKQAVLCARHACISAVQALASLYFNAQREAMSRPISMLPSPGISGVNTVGIAHAVPSLISYLLRLLSVPLVEVYVAVCELISSLATTADYVALSQSENMVCLL